MAIVLWSPDPAPRPADAACARRNDAAGPLRRFVADLARRAFGASPEPRRVLTHAAARL